MSTENLVKGLEALEQKLDQKLAEHTEQTEKFGKASTELTGQIDQMSQKLAEQQAMLTEMAQKQEQGAQQKAKGKSLGEQFVKSDDFQDLVGGKSKFASLQVKNTILGADGSPLNPSDVIVAPDRLTGIVPGAFRTLNILDLIPRGVTSSNQVFYTQEDTWQNDAAEHAEGGEKAESDLTFKLVEEPVRDIAHTIKLSRQVLNDAPMLEGYVNRRLVHGVRARLQRQIIQGNGTSPNIKGLNQTGRSTAFTPTTGEVGLDAINRAKYLVIAADYSPNAVFINPSDWGTIEREKVSGGGYALGDGAAVTYVANGMIPQVWGLTVIPSNDVPSGKFFVLDTNAIELFMREEALIEMGWVNDDFRRNLVTLRGEIRAALAVYHTPAIQFGDLTI